MISIYAMDPTSETVPDFFEVFSKRTVNHNDNKMNDHGNVENLTRNLSTPNKMHSKLLNPYSEENGGEPFIKQFKSISKKEEYKWSLAQNVATCANKNTEKYISEKDIKEAILLKFLRSDNIDPV